MIKRFGSLAAVITALSVALSSAPALAGAQKPNLFVNTTVITDCTAMTAQTLAFGSYDPLAASALNAPTAAQFSSQCSKGDPVSFTLNGGAHYNGTGVQAAFPNYRAMTDGTQFLAYQLYQDTSYASGKAWAFDTGTGAGTTSISLTGNGVTGAALQWNVYGQIPAGQDVEASGTGTVYNDTVQVTLSY